MDICLPTNILIQRNTRCDKISSLRSLPRAEISINAYVYVRQDVTTEFIPLFATTASCAIRRTNFI